MAEKKRNFDIIVSKPESITGGITVAPLGTEIPGTFKTKLSDKFTPMGYVNEAGLTLSEDASDEEIKVWGGVKVRTVRSEYSAKIKFTLHSTADLDVNKTVFGPNNVSLSDEGVLQVKHGADIPPVQAFTIETKDPNNGYQRRFAIPRGQITVAGDRNLTHSAADGLEVSIECLADPETGICYTEYTLIPDADKAAAVRAASPGGVPGAGVPGIGG